MKSKNGWLILLIIGLVLLIFVPGLLRFGMFWGNGFMMDGYGMMGRGFAYANPWGWCGSILMWLIPALGWFLLVIGVVGLVVYLVKPANVTPHPVVSVEGQTCKSCGKTTQPDWTTCPYCGNPLA